MNKQITPDWEIGKLYNQAWSIVRKYKVLWLFGISSGAGISLNSNFGGQGIDADTIKNLQKFLDNGSQEHASNALAQVLGASTSIFSSVPFLFYVILGIEILVAIVLFAIVGFIYSAWSQAALLEGIQSSLSNGTVSIRDSSEKAMSSIKPLIWLLIVPMLILALAILGFIILTAIFIAMSEIFVKVILGIILLLSLFAIIYCFIYLIFSQIWAPRIAVIEKASGKDSLFRGYRIAKKKKWSMMLLGFVNIILSGIVIGLPIILVLGFIIGGVFALDSNKALSIGLLAGGALLALPLLIGMIVIGGILNAFKATVWSIAYDNIRGKYDPSTSSGS